MGHHIHPLAVQVAEGKRLFLVHAALDGSTGYNGNIAHEVVLQLPQRIIGHFSGFALLRLAEVSGKLLGVACCNQCGNAVLQLGGDVGLWAFPHMEQRLLKGPPDGQAVLIVAQQNILLRDHGAVYEAQQKADGAFQLRKGDQRRVQQPGSQCAQRLRGEQRFLPVGGKNFLIAAVYRGHQSRDPIQLCIQLCHGEQVTGLDVKDDRVQCIPFLQLKILHRHLKAIFRHRVLGKPGPLVHHMAVLRHQKRRDLGSIVQALTNALILLHGGSPSCKINPM